MIILVFMPTEWVCSLISIFKDVAATLEYVFNI